jgi:hypothetical protein
LFRARIEVSHERSGFLWSTTSPMSRRCSASNSGVICVRNASSWTSPFRRRVLSQNPARRCANLVMSRDINIRLEFRDAAGEVDRLPAIAEEVVGAGDVDVIVAISTPAALAAHKATETIPIVAFTAVDPVDSGLANSLASPGRNVTGIAVFSEETTVKRVELLREVAPLAIRLATVTTKVSKGDRAARPGSEGRKTRRSALRASDQIRSEDRSSHRPGDGHRAVPDRDRPVP